MGFTWASHGALSDEDQWRSVAKERGGLAPAGVQKAGVSDRNEWRNKEPALGEP